MAHPFVVDPNGVAFEQDKGGLRWTWLGNVTLVWMIDLLRLELDVIDVWDEVERPNKPRPLGRFPRAVFVD